MSTASSPNPKNMMLLGVLAIGTYWIMTRQAHAQAIAARPAGSNAAASANALTGLIGAVSRLFGGSSSSSSAPAGGSGAFLGAGVPSGVPTWDAAYARALASSATDGLAVNVPSTAPYDAASDPNFVDQGQYL